jgi:intracellular septation protein
MKFLFDLLPIIIFFAAYKFFGIYAATASAMLATVGQIAWIWWRQRTVQPMHMVTLALILTFGTATLVLKDPLFIKWKPTVLYWLLALALPTSHYLNKPILQRMIGQQIVLSDALWMRLTWAWSLFFILVGGANIAVAYLTSENTWVNFKLFGIMGMTLLFIVAQAILLSKHIQQPDECPSQ